MYIYSCCWLLNTLNRSVLSLYAHTHWLIGQQLYTYTCLSPCLHWCNCLATHNHLYQPSFPWIRNSPSIRSSVCSLDFHSRYALYELYNGRYGLFYGSRFESFEIFRLGAVSWCSALKAPALPLADRRRSYITRWRRGLFAVPVYNVHTYISMGQGEWHSAVCGWYSEVSCLVSGRQVHKSAPGIKVRS